MAKVNSFSSEALRVLAIAIRPLKALPFDVSAAEEVSADEKMATLCKDLTLVGLSAAIDPPRPGVKEAVLDAYDGHVRVIMITGDYVKTAAAIAKDINILGATDDESKAVDCVQLRPAGPGCYIDDLEIDKLTFSKCVFARAQPEDKLMIVESLQRQGYVSAMTGDGVNDAPALKAADIGVAMGIQGTEVAKGASDMILTDDNFISIVTAVEKGRVIYAGIQKFVAFIMSVHIAEVMQIFFCIVCEFPIMRTPLQILFLILVTDLPPSIALGMEPGQAGIMKEWPRPKEQSIILNWMWQSIVVNGLILSVVIITVFLWALMHYVGELNSITISMAISDQEKLQGIDPTSDDSMAAALEKARTVAFISLVWSENVRAYTSRSFERPFFVELCSNKRMQMAIGMAQVALYVAIFVPGLSGSILKLRGTMIGVEGWIAAFMGAVGCLVLCEIYKKVTGFQKRTFEAKVRAEQEANEAARQNVILGGGNQSEKLQSFVPKTDYVKSVDAAPMMQSVVPSKPAKDVFDENTNGNGYDTKKQAGKADMGFLGCLCFNGMSGRGRNCIRQTN
jgi:magnesium-transporting ATPase (P-type)